MNKYQKEIESLLTEQFTQTSKEIKSAYDKALKEMKNKVEYYMMQSSALSYSQKLEVGRLTSLMLQMENELDFLNGVQKDHMYKFLESSGHIAFNELFYDFEMTKGFSIEFNMLNKKLLQTIVDTPIKGVKLSTRLEDGVISSLKANLLSQLQVGLAQGKSYEQMAHALSDVADSSYKRAMTIMRTEAGRVQSVTRQKSQSEADKRGIEFEKVWSSALSLTTRDSHRALDGQAVKPDEKFKSPVSGHEALQPHMFGVASEDINCRCRTFSRIKGYEPTHRRDNETGEIIPYKTYEEWEKGRTGQSIPTGSKMNGFDKTNMSSAVGKDNYNNFLKHLNSIEDDRVKELLEKFGDQLDFSKISDSKDYVRGRNVQLSQGAFSGRQDKNPMQTVFHELGHAIDNIGIDVIGSDFDRVSGIPGYQLKKDINRDLLNLFNSDLAAINGSDYQQVKNLKKLSIFDQGAIIRKYKRLSDKNPMMYSALSDLMESTGAFVDHPLGVGHGKKYWKSYGMQEAEFFAHMSETVVNKDARQMMYELFPTASKKWEKMLDDILKKVK